MLSKDLACHSRFPKEKRKKKEEEIAKIILDVELIFLKIKNCQILKKKEIENL